MSRQNGAPKNLCDSLDAGSRLQLQDIPQEIRKVSEIFRIKRGKKLYKQGSHNTYIYYLVDGYVVIATEALSDKRDNPIIDIKNAGSWLGLHAYMNNNSPAPDYVYAQTDCTVVRVPLSAVSGSDNMDLISELNNQIIEHYRHLTWYAAVQATSTVETRTRILLHGLAERYGVRRERGQLITLDLSLTHHDLARMAGISRETITRIIAALAKNGIVTRTGIQRDTITISAMSALACPKE